MIRARRAREASRLAIEAEKRKRATMLREQAERNRDDVRAAGDSYRVIAESPNGDPTPRTATRVLDPQTSNDQQQTEW